MDKWDKRERDYDDNETNYTNLLERIDKCEREVKYLYTRLKQNEDDLQFMANKMVQVLNTLKAHGIKV